MRLRGIRSMGAAGREARKASMQVLLDLALLIAGTGANGIGTGTAIETEAGTAGRQLLLCCSSGVLRCSMTGWYREVALNLRSLGGGPKSEVPQDSGTTSEQGVQSGAAQFSGGRQIPDMPSELR